MYTKAKIFNLALGALLLTKRISDTESDTSSENQTLNVHWETALYGTLQDLDLDGTSSSRVLELLEQDPNDDWTFAYKYPSDCAMLRRIKNSSMMDTPENQIPRRTGIHKSQKVIFTDAESASIEYIKNDFDLRWLSPAAGLAISYRLAVLSAPLIGGKGATKLREEVEAKYTAAKFQAQAHDRIENQNFVSEEDQSSFVAVRMS